MSAVRYFRVPAERRDEPGMFIGGLWVGFAKADPNGGAVATVPAGGDYSWAMPNWAPCQMDGSDLVPEKIPSTEDVEAAQAASAATGESGGENGASGEPGSASETDPK